MTNLLRGRCHCGAIEVELASARGPAELPVRVCGCTFCRRAGARYTSDPAGAVTFTAHVPAALIRYRFGLGLADFLSCGRCGSFVGALEPGAPGRAVVNLNVLDDAPAFTAAPATMSYDAEDEGARRARRARAWTPATLRVVER